MTYLDYSATTMVDKKVLDCYKKYCNVYKQSFDDEKDEIKKILNTNLDVLFTSGSTESNNAAIMGIANKYKCGKIISTKLEHSSVNECLKFLEKKGYIIEYAPLKNGVIDIEKFNQMLTSDTILVSIASVNSETGILQPIDEIGEMLKKKKIIFHSDMTQSIGKVNISFKNVDLITFCAHKFYGLKGIGVLLKKSNIELKPIIYGKRYYNYALIKSLVCALSLSIPKVEENYKYVLYLKNILLNNLSKYKTVHINSNNNSIPHIVNISIFNVKPESFLHMLEEYNIYISTKSACSTSNNISSAVFALTGSKVLASHSIRISLSYLTTTKEIDDFLHAFDICYSKIVERK